MVRAVKEDEALVVAILSVAFQDNLSVRYLVGLSGIRALMRYSFRVCRLFGEVWLSEDRKACALVLFPERKRTTLYSIWLDVQLVIFGIGLSRLGRALRREKLIAEKQPAGKGAYLWFIGVQSDEQHLGIGSALLKEVLEDADRQARMVFLETSTLSNLPWYQRFGFERYDELKLSYTLYFLKRAVPAA